MITMDHDGLHNNNSNNINRISMMQDPKNSIDYSSIMKSTGFLQQAANLLLQLAGGVQNLDNLTSDITGVSKENVMSNMTVGEYARYWVENVTKPNRKESTADRYLTSIELLEKYSISQIKVKDVIADDITTYLHEVASEYAYSTVKKQRTIVTAPLKHALGNKVISIDVTKGVVLPKPEDCKKPPREIKDFSIPEQKKLWAEIEKFESYCDYALGFQLETGMRINEALALVWDDIEFGSKPRVHVHKTVTRLNHEKKTFISPTPKTASSNRKPPLSPRALFILKKLQATSPNEWVFSDEEGKRLTYDSVRSRLKTICKRAGVKYQSTHANRHSFTTNLFEAGADHKAVSKMLGHSESSFTEKVYNHLRGDGYDQMYEAIMQFAQ